MFRYVAAVWSTSCAEQCAAVESIHIQLLQGPERWHEVFRAGGLRVYCTGLNGRSIAMYPLAHNVGVALGTVFTAMDAGNDTARRATFDDQATKQIVTSEGRALIQRYWGRYVAFIRASDDRGVLVLRSASGEIDCLSTSVEGVRLYFSATEHCPVFKRARLPIDWEYVAAQISTSMPETRRTGLAHVERILHGECALVRGNEVEVRSYWDPVSHVSDSPIEDCDYAADLLRRTTRACVDAWASCYDSVICMLSGGLDSSIVVNLLASVPSRPKFISLNYYNRYDAVSDERAYAHMAAERAGSPIVEYDSQVFDLHALLTLPRRAEPVWNVFDVGRADFERDLARQHAAKAYVLGHGGDQIFFQNGAQYICPDYIHGHGRTLRVLPVALDAARMEGRALWPTLVQGLRDSFRNDPTANVMKGFHFSALATRETVDAVRSKRMFLPAAFDSPRRIPPGKCWQVFGLSLADEMYTCCARDDDPEYVSPFLSQPMQELCLRIPTYVLTCGATDRGLARRAFAPDVPARILRRRAKASVGDYAKAIVTANKALLVELLLDGHLVRERLLDKAVLDRTFRGDGLAIGLVSPAEILAVAGTEAWLRGWTQ